MKPPLKPSCLQDKFLEGTRQITFEIAAIRGINLCLLKLVMGSPLSILESQTTRWLKKKQQKVALPYQTLGLNRRSHQKQSLYALDARYGIQA